MKVFKKIDGSTVHAIKHILEVIGQHPDVEIHIGTDSQNLKRSTKYATVIAFRYDTRGVHYIYSNTIIKPKIRDHWTRLFKEAEMSVEIANWVTESIKSVEVIIDMDYSPESERDVNFSGKVVSAARGYAMGLGYKVLIKPVPKNIAYFDEKDYPFATKAADHHCRH